MFPIEFNRNIVRFSVYPQFNFLRDDCEKEASAGTPLIFREVSVRFNPQSRAEGLV
jgi:hypothetical protein